MRTVKIAYPLLLLALALPATASAQTPPPDEPAAARAMADATKRAFADLAARYQDAIDQPSRTCKPLDTLPRRYAEDGFTVVLGFVLRTAAPTIAPRLRELRTELANIRTADPALISGRAAWRRWGRALETVQPVRGDLCAAIGRWRKAGYPRSAVRDAERALVAYAPTRGMLRRTKTAARRMVELGVPRSVANSFDLGS